MSLFRVKLNNLAAGNMVDNEVSFQRTIYVEGPNHTHRSLKHGDEFVDCNYWKRFAYPQVPLVDAFIEVIEDDGSIYADHTSDENTYPKVFDLTIDSGSVFADNVIDITEEQANAYAIFVQINNKGNADLKVRLNGSASAIFDLAANEAQVFNHKDIMVTKLEFANEDAESGAVQVITSIKSYCAS